KGGTVPRMEQTDDGYVLKQFPVFGPRALAGIGTKILDATTRDRTFEIAMRRQTKAERRESFRMRRVGTECRALHKDIADWAKNNRTHVEAVYDNENDFNYLDDFKDRTIDIAQPLAAILEAVYEGRDGIEHERLMLVHAIAITRKEEEFIVKDHRLLRR